MPRHWGGPYQEEFGSAVREALEAAGLSARRLALKASEQDLGISVTTITQMCRGYVPSAELVLEFALAIGADPDTFLRLAGKPFRYAPVPADDGKCDGQREAR